MIEFESTGTIWKIQFFEKISESRCSFLETLIRDEISRLDIIFSRFNPDSQLFKLNTNKQFINPNIELVRLLTLALEMEALTNQVFTPFIGSELVSSGYGPGEVSINKSGNNLPSMNINQDKIILSTDALLDLGAFAKGYIVDQIAALLISLKQKYFVINAGGDIYTTSDNDKPVTIFVENFAQSEAVREIQIKNGAVCTSANNRRVWKDKDGMMQKHIRRGLDPSIMSVSVTAAECMIADLLTSIIFLTGEKYIQEIKARFGEFDYLIQGDKSKD